MVDAHNIGEKYVGNLTRRELIWRVVKVSIKVAIVALLYLFLVPFLQPVFQAAPEIGASLEIFVVVYVVFMIVGDLTAKTIFQYIFNIASAFFVLIYFVYALDGRVVSLTVESSTLSLDLTTFYVMVLALSLLGLARAFLQLINFLSERAELGICNDMKS